MAAAPITQVCDLWHAALDIWAAVSPACPWVRDRGLLPAAPDPVMACHGQQLRGTRSQLYALLMQALG